MTPHHTSTHPSPRLIPQATPNVPRNAQCEAKQRVHLVGEIASEGRAEYRWAKNGAQVELSCNNPLDFEALAHCVAIPLWSEVRAAGAGGRCKTFPTQEAGIPERSQTIGRTKARISISCAGPRPASNPPHTPTTNASQHVNQTATLSGPETVPCRWTRVMATVVYCVHAHPT